MKGGSHRSGEGAKSIEKVVALGKNPGENLSWEEVKGLFPHPGLSRGITNTTRPKTKRKKDPAVVGGTSTEGDGLWGRLGA